MSQINQAFLNTPLQTLTGDLGGAVAGAAGNINIIGTLGEITVTGFPIVNTLVLSVGAGIPLVFHADAGDASPALNALTIAGGTNIATAGAGSTITVNLDDTITLTRVNATTFDTNVAAAGVTLAGTTLAADGTDAAIDINLKTKGAGVLYYYGMTTGFTGSEWGTKQAGMITTDGTPTSIIMIPVAEGEMVTIKGWINGFRSTFTDSLGAEILMTVYRPIGGNVTQIGEEIININSTCIATIVANADVGMQTADIFVVGIVGQTWNWAMTFNFMYTKTSV